MLSSVISEAVNALLDQHSSYSQEKLTSYLSHHYPEIPDQLRAPIVLAATAGAQKAASMHNIWEKNIHSPDPGKRGFAMAAASSLSFWALGLLPVHRSGDVYVSSSGDQGRAVAESVRPPSEIATYGRQTTTTATHSILSVHTAGDQVASHESGETELHRGLDTSDPLEAAIREIRGRHEVTGGNDKRTAMSEAIQLPVPVQ